MAFLRTLRILEDIHTLFEESDFELRTNKKMRKQNKDKLQICSNINGTVTVVAPCRQGGAVYMTFDGSGTVELWPQKRIFKIDWERTAEDNRKRFRNLLTEEYELDFKNGEHQVLNKEMKLHMLPRARIIPQIFQVFGEDFIYLRMHGSNLPRDKNSSSRFAGGILPDGRIIFKVGIENLEHCYSYAHYIHIIFDGSEMVAILDMEYVSSYEGLDYEDKINKVKVCDARKILIEQYGVSFEKEWRMKPLFIYPYN